MNAPPEYAIDAARLAAVQSPCAKSKRGAVLFKPSQGRARVAGRGFNGPPHGFTCRNNGTCRAACAEVCLHAEQRAIMDLREASDAGYLELVHVKVVDGAVVAGGGPSCLQCSRHVVEAGLLGVWLLEAQRWHDELPCETCSAITIVKQGEGTTGVCERCLSAGRLLLGRSKTIYAPDSGVWKQYTAAEFHRATLDHHGLARLGVDA